MSLLSDFSNAADIRRAIKSKARAYVPEWYFSENDPDGGTALALAFADMFGETAERLERVPYKYFQHFLNIIGMRVVSVSPATGMASFRLTENSETGRRIPAGTQLYADVESGENENTRVVFETENEITAVPSALIGMYCFDPKHDVINAIDLSSVKARLFRADKKNNLQAHRFLLWNPGVLNIKHPARITVMLESGYARHNEKKNNERLTDPDFAAWTFVRNGVSVPVTRAYVRDGAITLELEGLRPLPEKAADSGLPEDGGDLESLPHLVCDMYPGAFAAGIIAQRISLSSSYLHPERSGVHIAPDHIYYNDIALKPQDPGYLFGTDPGRYDTLLISSDEVLSKRGAKINLEFVMHTIIREKGSAPQGPVYDWDGRYIIEKSEGRIITPDNIYITEIVWEYWNDVGWAHLEVDEASGNPFKSNKDLRHESISFTCPGDITESHQNSILGYWIRARIVGIENPHSQYGLWQLPFAESLSFDYDYGSNLQDAQMLKIENNAESMIISSAPQASGLSLFKPFPYPEHAVYLAFDKQPSGLPLSIFIGFNGVGASSRILSFERLSRNASGKAVFRACKFLDGTGGLKDSGLISIYVPEDMEKARIFGLEAYWLRIVDSDLRYADYTGMAAVGKIELNAVEIVQKQTVSGEYYSTELYESGKSIELPERPILRCEVFVDELNRSDKSDDLPGAAIEYNADGEVSGAWVKWDIVPSLSNMGPETRAVSLDAQTGMLKFGDGICGRVPPAGTRNIRISYSHGGGALGNLPAGAIIGLVSNIASVASATNFTSTGGGDDRGNIHALERIGPARLRHRGRAVTPDDFETLILEQFPNVAAAKAFAGLDADGLPARSFVTIVLLPGNFENRDQVLKICRNAYRFLAGCAHSELVSAGRLAVVPALIMTVSAIIEAVAEDITRAAETERAIQNAVAERLHGRTVPLIGYLPSTADIFDCLRNIPNLSYVYRVSLEGQYSKDGRQVLTSLDKRKNFPFACVRGGVHKVII